MAGAQVFYTQLSGYKKAIDDDIAAYAEAVLGATRKQYGDTVTDTETAVFLDMLQRGGKRIRGALTIVGYEMCGGKNRAMIVQAARAIEMLHAYILIIDDIQDRSLKRRGKLTAHEMLAQYHRRHHLKGDARHAGVSLALMSALSGGHAAQTILANLDADPQLRLNALSITNRTLAITAHGQTLDVMNALVEVPRADEIDQVLEMKTALYTVTNPLHVGMVLAGAGCEATDAITPYGTYAGKAFQITDDILGIFGEEQALGKVPGDDIREGKGTVLTAYALAHASAEDAAFLRAALGNSNLTAAEFERCQRIIERSGARAIARDRAAGYVAQAYVALDAGKQHWSREGNEFLRSMAGALEDRTA